MNENCKKRWFSIDSCVVARKVWSVLDAKASKTLISLSRNSLRKVIFAMTGYWPIGSHGKRMQIPVSTPCVGCGQPTENITPEHFWCSCPGLSDKRMKFLKTNNINCLEELKSIDGVDKINFILNSGWFAS